MQGANPVVAETIGVVGIVYDVFKTLLFPVQTIDAVLGSEPKRASAIFVEALDLVAAQTVGLSCVMKKLGVPIGFWVKK